MEAIKDETEQLLTLFKCLYREANEKSSTPDLETMFRTKPCFKNFNSFSLDNLGEGYKFYSHWEETTILKTTVEYLLEIISIMETHERLSALMTEGNKLFLKHTKQKILAVQELYDIYVKIATWVMRDNVRYQIRNGHVTIEYLYWFLRGAFDLVYMDQIGRALDFTVFFLEEGTNYSKVKRLITDYRRFGELYVPGFVEPDDPRVLSNHVKLIVDSLQKVGMELEESKVLSMVKDVLLRLTED